MIASLSAGLHRMTLLGAPLWTVLLRSCCCCCRCVVEVADRCLTHCAFGITPVALITISLSMCSPVLSVSVNGCGDDVLPALLLLCSPDGACVYICVISVSR